MYYINEKKKKKGEREVEPSQRDQCDRTIFLQKNSYFGAVPCLNFRFLGTRGEFENKMFFTYEFLIIIVSVYKKLIRLKNKLLFSIKVVLNLE